MPFSSARDSRCMVQIKQERGTWNETLLPRSFWPGGELYCDTIIKHIPLSAPGACGPTYYCTPFVCVLNGLGGLAVWWLAQTKHNKTVYAVLRSLDNSPARCLSLDNSPAVLFGPQINYYHIVGTHHCLLLVAWGLVTHTITRTLKWAFASLCHVAFFLQDSHQSSKVNFFSRFYWPMLT